MERYWKKTIVITFVGANLLIAYYNFSVIKEPTKSFHAVELPSPSPQRRTVPPTSSSQNTESEPKDQQVISNGNSLVIRFQQGRQDLTAPARDGLLQIFNALNADRTLKVKIDGHTDSTGKADANILLSVQRAKLVRDYLVHLGIPEERIVVQGYGGTKPIADNGTKEGQAQNRRVEVSLIRET